MRIPRKTAAIAAAVAVMVPIGAAQATHDSGRAGAPGQVCKPLLEARKAQIKAAREDGADQEAIRALRRTQQVGYKGCIQAAAKARSADKPRPGQPPAG